ncbi:uncharacterized protein SETTUDRAFT_135966 [Exserohilum turcica Et28A]|uniref:Uncharacterized protein n=1 Tax=Exserohilum turcicum (strain 28A) TaxID=671987 RepID=R0IRI0_EXST2|nr:uncharacterized protein SETTUDRAFT_135966 [Exserohilum turcica Et28A]EOA87291.1 hypothetical protein SETTUDRAFT_135966 [Exserohilum turcica Et28A]
MNISGTLNIFRLLRDPTLCLPQHTVSTFNQLPIPLSQAFAAAPQQQKKVDIRAVVLDKDNCFAVPHTDEVYEGYKDHFSRLRTAYPGAKLLIVSNTAGTTTSDPTGTQAAALESRTGVTVLRHSTKKPGCANEVLEYFLKKHPETGVKRPDQIAVVGDRLATDVVMANLMGGYAVWVRDGVQGRGFFARMEDRLQGFLFGRGYSAPDPSKNQFE